MLWFLQGWNAFNVLQRTASTVGAYDVGYHNTVDDVIASKPKMLFLLGADDNKITRQSLPADCVVVYVGHHGDAGATIADIVLPAAAYTEKQGTYLNAEGRTQQTLVAVSPPGMAREDWKIIRAVSDVAGAPLKYNTFDELRDRIEEIAPHLTGYGRRASTSFEQLPASVGFSFDFLTIYIHNSLNIFICFFICRNPPLLVPRLKSNKRSWMIII